MPAAAQAACSLRASAVAKLVAVAKAKLYRRARRPGPERCDVNALWAKNAKNPFPHRGWRPAGVGGSAVWGAVRRHMRRCARWAAVNAHTHAQVHGPGALPMRVRMRTCVCFLVVGLLGSMLGYLVAILGHPGRLRRLLCARATETPGIAQPCTNISNCGGRPRSVRNPPQCPQHHGVLILNIVRCS